MCALHSNRPDSRCRLSVVEDDEGLCGLIARTLRRAGYDAACACSGAQALALIAEQAPCLLLLDRELPDMSGMDIVDTLWSREQRIPFIMMTGHGDERFAVDMMKRGAVDYLVKDTDLLDLLPSVVQRALGRIATEARLWKAEAALRETARIAKVGGWEIDCSDGSLSWTDETFRMHERELGQAPSVEEALAFYHPEDRPRVQRSIERALQAHEDFSLEVRLVTAKSHVIWVRVIGKTVVSDGRLVFVQGMIQDITDRKLAEDSIREKEGDYRRIVETASEGIWIVDADGLTKFVNQCSCDMLGYSRDELLGRPLFAFLHERERSAAMRLMERLHQGIKERHEFQFCRKDGGTLWCLVASNPILNDDGSLAGALGMLLDITDMKRAEEERAKLHAQLVQAQKMESVGRLAGGVAHDFNNMLGAIMGTADLALLSLDDPAFSVEEALRVILSTAIRSADLTRQLLAFARRQPIAPKCIDLNLAVEGMLKMLRQLISEEITLSWQPGAELGSVLMDPSQIDQILANLCVNARDAITGSGTVTLRTANAVLDEAFCEAHPGATPGEVVLLSVSDTGCGMDAETLAHAFEPFFTTKELGKGTGLGLATVYGIVKQNNGSIHIDSEPGSGSTFTIYLPRHRVSPVAVHAESAQSVQKGSGTVLVVEDEPTLRESTARMLARLGYVVLTAGTPEQALQSVEEHPGNIDLLLTDVIMPETNGRELAAKLLRLRPQLKCVYMSGYTADVIAHHGVLDDTVSFLQKPFTMKTLGDKLRETLR